MLCYDMSSCFLDKLRFVSSLFLELIRIFSGSKYLEKVKEINEHSVKRVYNGFFEFAQFAQLNDYVLNLLLTRCT